MRRRRSSPPEVVPSGSSSATTRTRGRGVPGSGWRLDTGPMRISSRLVDPLLDRLARSLAERAAGATATALLSRPRIYGDPARLHLAPTAVVNDSLFNLASGEITVGEWGMLAHGVAVLTGTHDVAALGAARQVAVPPSGRDVVIGTGAWLATNVTVIGPCTIGEHAVVAAGSVVRTDIPAYAIAAGVPARVVGEVPH